MVDELEIDPSYALKLGIQQMSSADITSKHSDMKLRINARCKDLLEVTPVEEKIQASLERGGLLHDTGTSARSLYEWGVDFRHRTRTDVLHLKEIYEWVLDNVSCGFDVDHSLCAAFLAQVKTVSVQNVDFQKDGQLSPLVDGMMHYARQIESRTNTSPTLLLESFYNVVRHHYWALDHSSDILIGKPSHKTLLDQWEMRRGSYGISIELLCHSPVAFSVHQDIQLYVGNKMDDRQGDLSLYRDDCALLYSAINPYEHTTASKTPQNNYNMLRLLISKGVNPTCVRLEPGLRERICGDVYRSWLEMAQSLELLETSTTYALGPRKLQWVMYVVKALRSWLRDDSPFESILSETIETFLRRGVNPNWVYGKHSLWTYFAACLYWDGSFPTCYSAKSQMCVLRMVKAFYHRGASRNQIIMLETISDDLMDNEDIQNIPGIQSRQYRKHCGRRVLNAHAAIKSVISAEGMQEIEFAERESTLVPTTRFTSD